MIRMRVTTRFFAKRVMSKVERANIRSLFRAAGLIRTTALRSIRKRKKDGAPSPPGQPPRTRRGRLREAILFAVDRRRQSAVIGPDRRIVGTSGAAHEFGGIFRGERFDRRAFMGPALIKTKDRLPKMWAGSVR